MNKYSFVILNSDGVLVMQLESSFTVLSLEDYVEEMVRPVLKALEATMGQKLFWSDL